MPVYLHHPSSFKDPAGFIFQVGEQYYRQVNLEYAAHYDSLLSSGLYQKLTEKKWLIPHTEVDENITGSAEWYKTLLPRQIPFISYAYEWSFNQLKDAAMLTLNIMKSAIAHDMILKDATYFNIQFVDGHPVFIDTLSFEKYEPSKPWIAYRQFCECFLFPLYLGYYLKTDIQKILSVYVEGVPVEVTARLLPIKSSLNMGVWLHVHLQNNVKEDKGGSDKQAGFDKKKLGHLLQHLESIISKFSVNNTAASTWSNYYDETILSQEYLSEKEKLFRSYLEGLEFKTAIDAGANDGFFSKILAERDVQVTAIDFDSQCMNNLYGLVRKNKYHNILPLCVDLTNPSPALGFMNRERQSFLERAEADLVTALALIHHLTLAKNIPLQDVAFFMKSITRNYLIIEFVPLEDPKAQELIKNKTSHHLYDSILFEECFSKWFIIQKKDTIPGTTRILYRLKKNMH